MRLEWELSWGQILLRLSILVLQKASGKWWRDVLFPWSLQVGRRWETMRIFSKWSGERWQQGEQESPLAETFSSTRSRERSYRPFARSSTMAAWRKKGGRNWRGR